jgi:Zn-dependent M28 family amino/carboxypeptidase
MAPPPPPPSFNPATAFTVIEQLAVGIGPREATSASFGAAADLVADRFRELGYDVQMQELQVPAGNSWGVPVPSGTTRNVVAMPPGFLPQDRHRLIGAHLDTVPQAPGAEDNASGIGVMVDLARMAAEKPPAVPVMFVAFGAEEPRGSGDALHHFGSRHMVATMGEIHRAAIAGMLSLDRVGVAADHVPVCHGGQGSADVREELVAAAGRLGIPVQRCENRASDHWSFEKASVPAARMGSIPYAGYHSAGDVPSVVDPSHLDRVGRIAAEWLLTQP